MPWGSVSVIHWIWNVFLNTRKPSFMLTFQGSLHLALICVNTLVFISSVKYLYGVTLFIHIYMPDKRFSYRGEKRTSESSPHVETRMGKQKQALYCCRLLMLNCGVYWGNDRTEQSSHLLLLCGPLTCAACFSVTEQAVFRPEGKQHQVRVEGSSKSPLLKTQCSLKSFKKFIVTFIKFSWVSVIISASNLCSLWWNKVLCS